MMNGGKKNVEAEFNPTGCLVILALFLFVFAGVILGSVFIIWG